MPDKTDNWAGEYLRKFQVHQQRQISLLIMSTIFHQQLRVVDIQIYVFSRDQIYKKNRNIQNNHIKLETKYNDRNHTNILKNI